LLLRVALISFLCLGGVLAQEADEGQQAADVGGYTGPAVLSKAGAPLGRHVGQPISFRWFAGAFGTYYTDLTQPITDGQGNLTSQGSFGARGTVGVSGARNGRFDTLGLSFVAGYRAYFGAQKRRNNGADVRLSLNYSRQLSRRTSFEFGAGVSSYGNTHFGYGQPVIGDPIGDIAPPDSDGFDGRTMSATGRAGVLHMLSPRWGFSFQGGGSYVERRSNSLVSSRAGMAGANLVYLVNATTSVGAGYSYRYFTYTNDFGDSNVHSAFLSLSKKLSEAWSLNGSFGASRLDTKRVVAVPLDPVLAAIVGQSTTLEPMRRISNAPLIRATIGRGFERSSFSVYYSHDFGMGNSYLTTSAHDSFGANYSYTATSRLNLGVNGRYTRHKAVSMNDAVSEHYGARIGASYRLTNMLHFTSAVGYHIQRVEANNFDRNRFHASVGISLSPGQRPLSLF